MIPSIIGGLGAVSAIALSTTTPHSTVKLNTVQGNKKEIYSSSNLKNNVILNLFSGNKDKLNSYIKSAITINYKAKTIRLKKDFIFKNKQLKNLVSNNLDFYNSMYSHSYISIDEYKNIHLNLKRNIKNNNKNSSSGIQFKAH
jgi:hypothetical protein